MSDCPQCDHGWRTVSPLYAEKLIPDPDPTRCSPENLEAATELVRQRRAGLLNTVYPCKTCHPAAFWRWHDRHWDSGHDETGCDDEDCQRGGYRKRTRTRPMVGARPTLIPRDITEAGTSHDDVREAGPIQEQIL